MNLSPGRARLFRAAVTFLTVVVSLPAPAGVMKPPNPSAPGGKPLVPANYDVRVLGRSNLVRLVEEFSGRTVPAVAAAARERRRLMERAAEKLRGVTPGAEVRFSPLTGSAEIVRGGRAPLSLLGGKGPSTPSSLC